MSLPVPSSCQALTIFGIEFKVINMNVSLTPELEKFVTTKVESGRYNSASEVVREALRLLDEHDSDRGPLPAAAQIRAAPEAASVSGYVLGTAVEFDLDDIWEYIAADYIDAA